MPSFRYMHVYVCFVVLYCVCPCIHACVCIGLFVYVCMIKGPLSAPGITFGYSYFRKNCGVSHRITRILVGHAVIAFV